jgi:DNA (cytosine-5)-methyltransferase 1
MFNYKWNLKDGYSKKHGLNVFGTFLCGGGSSMGYKLAGFNHFGGVELDKKMSEIYKTNHNPQYLYTEDIRDFNKRENLPKELYNLDILDGSPPCSTFSTAGSREKVWKKEKKFKEGQKKQILDDLFFKFIETTDKLKPKVVIGENVKGLIAGNAKSYVIKIKKEFEKIGYSVQLFLLNAASMGVPQKRERVFFICSKKELNFPKLTLNFKEKPIVYEKIEEKNINKENDVFCVTDLYKKYWKFAKEGQTIGKFGAGAKKIKKKDVLNTISSSGDLYHFKECRILSKKELILASSFPLDFDFLNTKPQYVMGMSVPPVMMAQVSNQIYEQWFKNAKN